MPKTKNVYVCQSCGYTSPSWIGQCPDCSEWNTFVEEVVVSSGSKSGKSISKAQQKKRANLIKLSEVISKPIQRVNSGISEFDRVLGGGFVSGQVVLISGEPGIGKSTILTEISRSMKDSEVLYVCGEESVEQIKLRVQRMGYSAENLVMLPETNAYVIGEIIMSRPDLGLVIVDSIQTLYSPDMESIPGGVSQVKGCASYLTNVAKETGIPMILVGHVTKVGSVAGPKVLEHIVDTVLQLEGDGQHLFRVLRTTKNRFGPLSEVGIFEMVDKGMREVKNPSELFLEHRIEKSPGSSITVIMEGNRPLLFEIQALTIPTSFGYPKRTTSGFSNNRLQVLIATIEKRTGVKLSNHDVYLNVAGGFSVKEYAADLSVCLAIISAVKNKPLKVNTLAFGEVGLSGEIRKVSQQKRRVQEAEKLGYKNIISPENTKTLKEAVSESLSKN
ncbi:DNA repair protein RadA [Patescibacteria group bacterium]|nr:DNA repair protein RadA [Patescibacteria group bacterium]